MDCGESLLATDECHVWCADLSASTSKLRLWEQSLSSWELERAARFRSLTDRHAYIARHGLLRGLLSSYLGMEPGELRFSCSPKGKPQLHPLTNPLDLRFNLSRSGRLALFALGRGQEVGVDVEALRPLPDWEAIAQTAFSEKELDVLKALPADQRQAGFFRGWTRKEAVLKALGDGIAAGMRHIEANLGPGSTACGNGPDGEVAAGSAWYLTDLFPAPAFIAAVAIQGLNLRVVGKHWAEFDDSRPPPRGVPMN